MKALFDVLAENPLILLFIVTAVGYPLGKIKFKGVSLGISAVLFTGIAAGSLDPRFKLPDIVYVLGLAIFVYSIGLSSGHTFVASLRRHGVRDNLFAGLVLAVGVGAAYLVARFFGLGGGMAAGMYAGSITNTPALAGVLDTIKANADPGMADRLLAAPVVGYSLAYPFGVVGAILALSAARHFWRIDYAEEAKGLKKLGGVSEELFTRSVRVEQPGAIGVPLHAFLRGNNMDVAAGRLKRGEFFALAHQDAVLREGDIVAITGDADDLARATALIGVPSDEHLEFDSSQFEDRRIFVSNNKIEGRAIGELELEKRFGCVITRLRRGDQDMIPHTETILEPGDRVRVLAQRGRMPEISRFFGDSYRASSEVDLLTFSLGLAAGLLIGLVPIPLIGGVTIKLGFAGGPLLAGLVLGVLEHTGGMVWNIPYSAHVTLRQIGLVLFLAGIGTRAGYGFASTVVQGGGLSVFFGGIAITSLTAFLGLWIGYRVLKIPFSLLSGMIAGLFTQPAVLAYALEDSQNDLPNIGYASVYPLATIFKILAAQFFVLL